MGVALALSPLAALADKRPVNVLFLMTDQQRWDALGCAGNSKIKTPNLDRLAREGAYFENAYSACPVCVPARASILTGQSITTTGVLTNGHLAQEDLPRFPTFDSILAGSGYRTEYYGKWHTPYAYAGTYANHVKPVNKGGGDHGETNLEAFRAYLDARCERRKPKPGELIDNMSQRPYVPLSVDWRHGMSEEEIEAFGRKYGIRKKGSKKTTNPLTSQAGAFGCLQTPRNCSLAAFEGWEALEALKRMDAKVPFSLTCSFGPPHPPTVVPEPYFSMYKPGEMAVPKSIDADPANSPHPAPRNRGPVTENSRDPAKVQEAKAAYYAMVTQVDEWAGKLLDALDAKGLKENTLVVFTSDHGDMMGDHGRFSKNILFEGSVHVPLILRLPGVIPAGTRIARPVSHIDIAPTILEYTGMPLPKTDGRSLRNLIEGKRDDMDFTVSIWGRIESGGPVMIRSGAWKLIVYAVGDTRQKRTPVNALYNLIRDPEEMNNLIGKNPAKAESLPKANELKKKLEAWMAGTRCPLLDALKKTDL